jgi:hypothetical protein
VAWQAGQTISVQTLLDNTPHSVSYTSNAVGSGGVTSETVFITSSSFTMRNGRAYRVEIKGLLMGTSPDTARLWVRRTNVTGTPLLDTQRVAIPSSGSNGQVGFFNTCSNSTGSDITDVVVWTLARGSGSAATVSIPASSTSPAYLEVCDIGAATEYPNATAIT